MASSTESTESNEEDPFETNISTTIINLGKAAARTMKKFDEVSEKIKINNSNNLTVIDQIIKQQKEAFRKFVKDSIEYSNNIEEYSNNCSFVLKCFNNKDYSSEDILLLLNDLLEKSQKLKNVLSFTDFIKGAEKENFNDDESTNTLNTLTNLLNDESMGIKEKLIKINNVSKEYNEKIKKSPREIDSDVVEKSTYRSVLFGITLALGVAAVVTGVAGAVVVAAEVSEATVITAKVIKVAIKTTSAAKLFSGMFVTAAGSATAACCHYKDFKDKRDELVEKIEHVRGDLKPIIEGIDKLEGFWEDHTEKIRDFIIKVQSLNDEERVVKQHPVTNKIKDDWKEVEEKCKIYSRVMKDLLRKSRLTDELD